MLFVPTNETLPEMKIHCDRCGWHGAVGEAKVIPDAIVQCPKCTGPCSDGHPAGKKP